LLRLSSGLNAGGFSPAREGKISDSLDFTKISARYPIRATIRVETGALRKWHREGYGPAMLLALALGLAFGFILAKALGNASPLGDLDRALALNQFKPYFQPIFDLRSGAITGCEVLARWVRSDGTIVPPMSFIPLAESSGKIEQITWMLLKTALGEMYPRLRQDKHFKLSINIVPRHLLKAGFVEDLRHIVVEARVSPRQIVLEVTERDELPDLQKAAAVVKDLRELGFRVAMDDVGVGHSGLSQMKGLGANTIKIDKFFVDTITKESSAVTIVEMLARLARELKMTVVAEGIETPEQIASLLACGIHEGQGYIVSPPLPFAKFDELLVKRQSGAVAGKPTLENALVA
jgi:c-di-GMP phosphodiesterase